MERTNPADDADEPVQLAGVFDAVEAVPTGDRHRAGTARSAPSGPRATWKAVAKPDEHGGWGLTAEPVLLGLLAHPSAAGALLAVAAFLAFLVRTPLKLVLVDLRRRRILPRTKAAALVVLVEALVLLGLAALVVEMAGREWLIVVGIALPFVLVQMAFDVRSRSRRLLPELCGAVGIAAVAPAIIVADGGEWRLAVAVWLILAIRSATSIPFVLVQVRRLRHGEASIRLSDVPQVLGVAAAGITMHYIDGAVWFGAAAILIFGIVHAVLVRRPPFEIKRLGFLEMGFGLFLVAVTALCIHLTP